MRKILLFVCLWPFLLCALWDEEEDLTLCHHVHVITGHLNLSCEDRVIKGAKPLSIYRSYTSEGALWTDPSNSISGGGWKWFPDLGLKVQYDGGADQYIIQIPQSTGPELYFTVEEISQQRAMMKAKGFVGPATGVLSGRKDPQGYELEYFLKNNTVILRLPNGGERHYGQLEALASDRGGRTLSLLWEKLPSGHLVEYSYNTRGEFCKIELKNPQGTKCFTSLKHLRLERGIQGAKIVPFDYQIITSDDTVLNYQATTLREVNYLQTVSGDHRPKEFSEYQKARKGMGFRLKEFSLGGELQFVAHYHEPKNAKEAQKWKDRGYSSHEGDKVRLLEVRSGENGNLCPLAQFSYRPHRTDVRDGEGVLTRYHHDDRQLEKIEYFDAKEQLHSYLRLWWQEGRLVCKALLDAKHRAQFARTFVYDTMGNVIEEAFWGNLTGKAESPLSIDSSGCVTEGECYRKRYQYLPRFNVPTFEKEEGGLTYRYEYYPGTDLVTGKWTCEGDKVLMRQFFLYDRDHLLIEEIVDDGTKGAMEDIWGVTYRKIRRHTRHHALGLITSTTELYWDSVSNLEIPIKRSFFRYSAQHQVIEEDIFDANDQYRYTLYTDYDAYGHVIRKTTPCGDENLYTYSPNGYLLQTKEVGSPQKLYTCTPTGKPTICREIDDVGHVKTTYSHYDDKGRLLSQTDSLGNTTIQEYNVFGQCLKTQFPTLPGNAIPCVRYAYDVMSNIITMTSPEGGVVRTTYNAYRKPIHILQADGTEIFHTYTLDGLLKETLYPDKTRTLFTYDGFHRMLSKVTYSGDGILLEQEQWKYNAFHLLEYTDPKGLTTFYTYDFAGRKVAETAENRKKTFAYDALNFLEATTSQGITHILRRDLEGHVTAEWTEDEVGRRENEMGFFYDKNHRKVKAIRKTSQGNATDLFAYDAEGRLIQHTDPLGAVTYWEYTAVLNELNQQVLQKTTVDPLAQRTIETYDALGHLARFEKQDSKGESVSLDLFEFSPSGQQIRRLSTLYQGVEPLKTLETRWVYDLMGRMIKQIEPEGRTTRFVYDKRGRLAQKIFPSKKALYYQYDGIDRITALYSSDGTIHHGYSYAQGPDPTQIIDYIHQFRIERAYNLFGELLHEQGAQGLEYTWVYDEKGRCIQFLLPDSSSVQYGYTGAHLTTITRATSDKIPLYTHTYTQFDPNGHIVEERFIDGSSIQSIHRDLLERPIAQTSKHLSLTAAYGPSGLVVETYNSLFGGKGYQYDPLNQLIQEGSQTHLFDSCGNPTNCLVNDHHQILKTPEFSIDYDPDGNPISRSSPQGETFCEFDLLGRLLAIRFPDKTIRYSYDPLSRLLFKEIEGAHGEKTQITYLYDQNFEIGTATLDGQILELKVLGLGIRGDIGAAVAIELGGRYFVPQHDFNGHIIALLSMEGSLSDLSNIDAFGTALASSQNPWRFCSKRSEEGFVFFGERFYDPALKRWLTPDPAGPIDGPNLYLYVMNSPVNRLDLFGLYSEGRKFPWSVERGDPPNIELDRSQIELFQQGEPVECRASIEGVRVNLVVSCQHAHELQFSAEELELGKINLFDHLSELVPKEGAAIGLVTWQNGMDVNKRDFRKMSKLITNRLPEGTLGIGIHNPKEEFPGDIRRVIKEFFKVETPIVSQTRQMMSIFIETLPAINPTGRWLHICHSEGGLIARNSIEGLTEEQQQKMKRYFSCIALGPAVPLPKCYADYSISCYSDRDRVTGWFGVGRSKEEYNIKKIECETPWNERGIITGDHDFAGRTYQRELKKEVENLREKYGFYQGR